MSFKQIFSFCALTLVIPALAMAQGKAGGVEYYRYIDQQGQVVISRQGVPNELIGNGYEVLNGSGRVIRRVPRAPTAEEIAHKQQLQLQEQENRRLLRLYTIADDVDRARDSKLDEVETLINIHNTELFELASQRGDLIGKAANLERTGRAVPRDILDSIAALEQQEQQVQEKIASAELRKDAIREEFALEKERLLFLLQNKKLSPAAK